MTKCLRTAMATAALLVAGCVGAGAAAAQVPTGDYARFANCPFTNLVVEGCIHSTTTSGSFKLGNTTVAITADTPIVLQGGVGGSDSAGNNFFYSAVGADTLSKTKLAVPGGLVGLLPGALIPPSAANDVFATAEVVGQIKFNAGAFLGSNDPALQLPLRIHLENPTLGPNCYIGSPTSPVTLRLVTGSTSPPPPGTPLTGSIGEVGLSDDFGIFSFLGARLVDNSFSVPAATNCGRSPRDVPLVTAALNAKEGLPSARGRNAAILQGDTYLGFANAVRANAGP